MKILYLEDNIELSQTVEEILTQEGYEVAVAYSAKEVFDIFIFDVNLPDMNGFELRLLID